MSATKLFKQLTPEQRETYLKDRGHFCPFCGELDISGGSMEFDVGRIEQVITCECCHEKWWDVYELVNVASDESEERIGGLVR